MIGLDTYNILHMNKAEFSNNACCHRELYCSGEWDCQVGNGAIGLPMARLYCNVIHMHDTYKCIS